MSERKAPLVLLGIHSGFPKKVDSYMEKPVILVRATVCDLLLTNPRAIYNIFWSQVQLIYDLHRAYQGAIFFVVALSLPKIDSSLKPNHVDQLGLLQSLIHMVRHVVYVILIGMS